MTTFLLSVLLLGALSGFSVSTTLSRVSWFKGKFEKPPQPPTPPPTP